MKKHSKYFAASLEFNKSHGSHEEVLKDDNISAMWVRLIYLHPKKEEDPVDQQDKDEDGKEKEEVFIGVASGRNEESEKQADLFESDGIRDTGISSTLVTSISCFLTY